MRQDIAPATVEDYEALMGRAPEVSFWGYAVRAAGQPVALGGVYNSRGVPIVFSHVTPTASKRAVLLTARRVLETARRKRLELFAVCDASCPTAPGFMAHFGFAPVGQCRAGEVYRWLS